MAQAFTCFEKFGTMCEMLSDDDRKLMVYAIGAYGMLGEEPELPYPLNAMFMLIKDDIDNSKASRANASRGGRPKGQRKAAEAAEETEVCESEETGYSEPAKTGVSQTEKTEVLQFGKTGVSENEKPGFSESGNRGFSKNGNPIQANTSQYKPSQTNVKSGAHARFTAPTPDEVSAYAAERGIDVDGEAFCDFYAAKGWKVGTSPMRDWRAAARNWARRDGPGNRPGARGAVSLDASLSAYDEGFTTD